MRERTGKSPQEGVGGEVDIRDVFKINKQGAEEKRDLSKAY